MFRFPAGFAAVVATFYHCNVGHRQGIAGSLAHGDVGLQPAFAVRLTEIRVDVGPDLRVVLQSTNVDRRGIPTGTCEFLEGGAGEKNGIHSCSPGFPYGDRLDDDLVVALDLNGVAASTGSACASGKQEASTTLESTDNSSSVAKEVVRFSLDWDIDEQQTEQAAEIIKKVVVQMRSV